MWVPPSSSATHSSRRTGLSGLSWEGRWPQEPWLPHPLALATLTLCLLSCLHPPALSSSIWLLLKNPVFILLCLAGATEATLIAGMSTFGPKFLESQFSLSASEAATLFGEKSL